ncbi:MAG: methylmalonyl-CoA mutase, partial [Candidatus Rokubacteria bacterium]|nr:methylmalonyl-CoA mutase [Candidatus Rokubacteria bacterium]
ERGLQIPVVVGGSVLTPADQRLLSEKGVAATFGPASSAEDIPEAIRRLVQG